MSLMWKNGYSQNCKWEHNLVQELSPSFRTTASHQNRLPKLGNESRSAKEAEPKAAIITRVGSLKFFSLSEAAVTKALSLSLVCCKQETSQGLDLGQQEWDL